MKLYATDSCRRHRDELVERRKRPVISIGIAYIGEPLAAPLFLVALQKPLGMFLPQPTVSRHPLQLKPDDRLDSHRVRMVVNGPQAVRKTFGIDLPGSSVRPRSIADIPSGVHPPIVDLDF